VTSKSHAPMKIISVNVGLPREFLHEGKTIRSGIFKNPVEGRVRVSGLNLDGDRQADLTVHGGPSKAVYVYPTEHYEYWRKELPAMDFPWGSFGENLSTEGLLENDFCVGDRLCAGSVEFMVTEPRLPCYKLAAKFGRPDMVKLFLKSRRTGFYLAVCREGEIGAGDRIQILSRDPQHFSVTDITRLYAFDKQDVTTLRRAVELHALSDSWRGYFRSRLETMSGS
jgi:MOSC domain-containing protein YiiM